MIIQFDSKCLFAILLSIVKILHLPVFGVDGSVDVGGALVIGFYVSHERHSINVNLCC